MSCHADGKPFQESSILTKAVLSLALSLPSNFFCCLPLHWVHLSYCLECRRAGIQEGKLVTGDEGVWPLFLCFPQYNHSTALNSCLWLELNVAACSTSTVKPLGLSTPWCAYLHPVQENDTINHSEKHYYNPRYYQGLTGLHWNLMSKNWGIQIALLCFCTWQVLSQ